MSSEHTPADDIVYDLVSIQYHALKSAEVYDKYIGDAHEHEDSATHPPGEAAGRGPGRPVPRTAGQAHRGHGRYRLT